MVQRTLIFVAISLRNNAVHPNIYRLQSAEIFNAGILVL
jgi:hypothetical protein